jgi:hypothetical protein
MVSGVIRSRVVFDDADNKLYHEQTQPTEDIILEDNANLRKDNALRDLSFGRQVASIPFILWDKAVRSGYDLNSPDSDIAAKELMRFLRSPEGQVCMVRDKL